MERDNARDTRGQKFPHNPSPEARDAAWAIAAEQFLDRLRSEVRETIRGVAVSGSRPIAVGTLSAANPNPRNVAVRGQGSCTGWSFRESAAAAATVYLRDGNSPDGDLIATIRFAANGTQSTSFEPGGISFQNGLFVDVAAGAVEGAVYVRAVD